MTFYRGQAVTRLKEGIWYVVTEGHGPRDATNPQYGVVYIVDAIDRCRGRAFLSFIGFKNFYDATAFRPVVSKDTSAEVQKLKKLLDQAPAQRRELVD